MKREEVIARSGGRCEGHYVFRDNLGVTRYLRCPSLATDIHHLLTRARGGRLLDAVGETYHLAHFCRSCHSAAHHDPGEGMIIDGYAATDAQGRVYYLGNDETLSERYPRRDDAEAQGAEAGSAGTGS